MTSIMPSSNFPEGCSVFFFYFTHVKRPIADLDKSLPSRFHLEIFVYVKSPAPLSPILILEVEGNYDLVGNNLPVFFIRDAIKFPDMVHAFKGAPDTNIPSASSAHNRFWDFISLTPESTHMIIWLFSDRGTPKSYRMQEGFGVNTYVWVNAEGKARYVKYHLLCFLFSPSTPSGRRGSGQVVKYLPCTRESWRL